MTADGVTQRVADQIDERSERWVTAIHEAAHAIAVDALGYRVISCRVNDDDATGGTDHTVGGGPDRAIVAVAGERATRLLLGTGGGSAVDYEQARHVLRGTGQAVTWAEDRADDLIRTHRRDVLLTARRLYWSGGR